MERFRPFQDVVSSLETSNKVVGLLEGTLPTLNLQLPAGQAGQRLVIQSLRDGCHRKIGRKNPMNIKESTCIFNAQPHSIIPYVSTLDMYIYIHTHKHELI